MRRNERHNTQAIYTICWQDQAGKMHSSNVQGMDLSVTGVRILSPVDLQTGSRIFIESADRHPTGYATVRHSTRAGNSYSIGLEFTEETQKSMEAKQESAEVDFYEFLQISPRAELSTIQRIYRFMASRFHPDNPETGDPEKFFILKRAYEVLSDPDKRAEYDVSREKHEVRANPIFETSEFVNGIEGEVNRRLGVLSLLYNRRRTNPENPKVSLSELEKRMGWPREYLDFTTWYLKSMNYITREDNSDFALTAVGVDYVESNSVSIPMLHKLLNSGSRTATSSPGPMTDKFVEERLLLGPIEPQTGDAGSVRPTVPQPATAGRSNGYVHSL
jgi:DnaJ-like protein/PilZ domain-containing protein